MAKTVKMRCRFVLVLVFMCLADSAAHVVNSFEECSEFFFEGHWPILSKIPLNNNNSYICQQYKGDAYFATLYMPKLRIPLFSAYRLDTFDCYVPQRLYEDTWFIEPQLSMNAYIWWCQDDSYYLSDMKANIIQDVRCSDMMKSNQALNEDYRNTDYDRGHLNPTSYQCDDARTATFTLTNDVPQNPCFYQQKWRVMEQTSNKIMKEVCNSQDAKRFFVTGVIPSKEKFIPSSEHDVEEDEQRDFERVNVPEVMWTAACCHLYNTKKGSSDNDDQGFSFSYVGFNKPDSQIKVMSVPDLRKFLDENGFKNAKIFTDDCFPFNRDSNKTLKELERATRLGVKTDIETGDVPENKNVLGILLIVIVTIVCICKCKCKNLFCRQCRHLIASLQLLKEIDVW